MGVHDLWKFLSPVGQRFAVSSLAGQRLAVDVSIWLVQFIKAMRNESTGELLPNAHLIGMFRRIARLLFYRVRPVFVFDGPAPALKKRTLAQRQRSRATARTSIERAAERILLNQLKLNSVQELRRTLAKRKKAKQDKTEKGKEKQQNDKQTENSQSQVPDSQPIDLTAEIGESLVSEEFDRMLAEELQREELESLGRAAELTFCWSTILLLKLLRSMMRASLPLPPQLSDPAAGAAALTSIRPVFHLK
jgi:DNA excision repair protein ERCC-5